MANNVYTIDHVTLEALDCFENNLRALKHCSRKVEPLFGQKGAQKGDSIRIRKPAEFSVRTGQGWSGQDVDEQYDTLVLNYQKGIDWSMSSKERKLDFNSIANQIIRPAMIRLANEVDKDILEVVSKATFNAVGTPGTSPTSYNTYRDAGVKLSNFACPRGNGQRFLHINAEMEGDIIAAGEGFFNRASKISSQYDNAEMDGEYIAGFNWSMDQNVYVHTNGTYGGTPLVNGANQSGSSLITDGWSSGASNLTVGQRFTIANVYAVNPVTKATLSELQQFVVTAAVSDSSGAMTISISPSIVGPGNVHQNVNALPADNAALTMFGTSAQTFAQGIAWNKEAVTVAIVPLDRPEGVNSAAMKYDEQSGVGVRYIEWYDGDTDLWKCRTDVVYGILLQRGEHSVAIAGA